jgi:hypothetical protein
MTIIGELVAGAVSEHVWVNWKWKLGRSAGSLDHPIEPSGGDRRAGLSREHIGARSL